MARRLHFFGVFFFSWNGIAISINHHNESIWKSKQSDRQMAKQNVVHTHKGIFSVLERKEIMTGTTAWINLEDFMLSETHQSQKDK